MVFVLAAGWWMSPPATAQQKLVIKPLAEKKVAELPAGPLFWLIENFDSRAQAHAAAGPWGLVVESDGRIWLFTLGSQGRSSVGGTRVAEVGPISPPVASRYLLRINEASGPPGSTTSVHSHPGSEAFYVLAGQQSIRTPDGVMRVEVGQPEAGHSAATPMQVTSTGTTDLRSLVMFIVDAGKPFSSPSKIP
jgi:hypothetical protein